MIESSANRWPDSGKAGRDGIRILLVRGESATTVSTLSFGDTHIPENQKVVLYLYLRFLASQDCAALYGEILPS